MAKGTKKKKEPRVIPGTSDYVVRENAARKQLGVAGLAARNKQVPTAARASLREMTGIDISRKGVSVDPMSLAMALPLGKVIKAARVLRAAGQAGKAEAVMSRAAAKLKGQRIGREFSYFDEPVEIAQETRVRSESVFPRKSFGTLESIPGLNPGAARRAAKSFGQAASGERGLARSLRNVPGERNRSMNLFKDSLANQRAGKAISKYKTPKVGR